MSCFDRFWVSEVTPSPRLTSDGFKWLYLLVRLGFFNVHLFVIRADVIQRENKETHCILSEVTPAH